MYRVNDMIIYGGIGVCRVTGVAVPDFCDAMEPRTYYALAPVDQTGTIFIPVDAPVFMRPVITAEEAERLIDMIPSIQAEAYHNSVLQELKEHYASALRSHDCMDLIDLIMSIYTKKQYREQTHQKFGALDEQYMKRAETLLYGEFSVALGIPKESVPGYIMSRVEEIKRGKRHEHFA